MKNQTAEEIIVFISHFGECIQELVCLQKLEVKWIGRERSVKSLKESSKYETTTTIQN